MAWLIPFSLAIWNWLFTEAISCTSYLRAIGKWREGAGQRSRHEARGCTGDGHGRSGGGTSSGGSAGGSLGRSAPSPRAQHSQPSPPPPPPPLLRPRT